MKKMLLNAVMSAGLILVGSGCQLPGALVAPNAHDKKIAAEYDLAATKQKVMVLIEESRSVTAGFNYRATFYDALSEALAKKVRVSPGNILIYRNPSADAQKASGEAPWQIAGDAGAQLVLYVRIERLELTELDSRGFYSGMMHTQSAIFDVATTGTVWPVDGVPRLTRVRIDLEKDGRDKTEYVLAHAAAHCISRHLYDCPKDRYRSGYEQTEYKLNEY